MFYSHQIETADNNVLCIESYVDIIVLFKDIEQDISQAIFIKQNEVL